LPVFFCIARQLQTARGGKTAHQQLALIQSQSLAFINAEGWRTVV
jgi:hypothetical protein